MDWSQVLVIILAIFLAIFLLLGIVFAIMLIRITQQIKAVTAAAQRTVEHIEETVQRGGRLVSPLLFLKAIAKLAKRDKKK